MSCVETPPIGAFVVDRRSGRLSTAVRLDRERTRVHRVLVAVTDVDEPTLSSTVNVTVFVADRNDNAPVVSFPRPGNDSVEVRDAVQPYRHAAPRRTFATWRHC